MATDSAIGAQIAASRPISSDHHLKYTAAFGGASIAGRNTANTDLPTHCALR
jgi:hypothetical protein